MIQNNSKATVSVVIAVISAVCLLILAEGIALGQDWLMNDGSGAWLLLPCGAFFGGIAAAYLGAIAWIDVRRGVTDQKLGQAKFGSILGGATAGLVILAGILLLVIFVILAISFPQG
jgi:hypothetical protein